MLFLSTPLVRDRAKERSGDRLTALLSKILGLWSSCFEPGGLPEDQASAASQWQPPSRPHPGLQVATTTTPLSLPVTTPFSYPGHSVDPIWASNRGSSVASAQNDEILLVPSWWHWKLAPLGSTGGPLELLEDGLFRWQLSARGRLWTVVTPFISFSS